MLKFRVVLALATLCAVASAGEVTTLRNGFTLRHQRHAAMGASTRLYLAGDSGYVDVPTAEIISITPEDQPPATAAAQPPAVVDPVAAASGRTGLDPALITSVIRAESGFNPAAVSPKGAQGLMQLMPATAAQLGVKDAFDPSMNVAGGSEYLRELLARYHNDLPQALAAYNAGPERVRQYGGVPPYQQTYAYVSRIIREFNRTKLAQQIAKPAAQHPASSPLPASAVAHVTQPKSESDK